ncbi:MAG: hypothetical protein WC815_03440 [Vicinamibacterales bacterium]|jgi:flagellar export protein FliJ
MRPFRFRASVVLDLRRKEEDAARQRLVQAQNALDQAEARARTARQAAADAAGASAAAQNAGAEGWRLGWHQSWIRRQRLEVDACRTVTAASAATVDRATASVGVAHQRRRVLERLRDRAWHRHQLETVRHESREMNTAANLRYLTHAAGGEATNDDD